MIAFVVLFVICFGWGGLQFGFGVYVFLHPDADYSAYHEYHWRRKNPKSDMYIRDVPNQGPPILFAIASIAGGLFLMIGFFFFA